MAIEYSSASIYIQEASSIKDKINRIDQVIDALLASATDAAANQDIRSYSLDDGQTSISASYRNVDEAFAAIKNFEKLKEYYINQLNGSVFRLVDSENFKRRL